jgi:hypothetical protein
VLALGRPQRRIDRPARASPQIRRQQVEPVKAKRLEAGGLGD